MTCYNYNVNGDDEQQSYGPLWLKLKNYLSSQLDGKCQSLYLVFSLDDCSMFNQNFHSACIVIP